MGHLFKNALRWKIRNFVCIFWPLVFPLLLGTLFHIALDNIGAAESMQAVSAAVVISDESKNSSYFTQFLNEMSQGDPPILDLHELTEKEARAALTEQSIDGYFMASESPSLVVAKSDIHSSILEMLLQMYTDHFQVITATMSQHPENLPDVIEKMKVQSSYLSNVSLGGSRLEFATQFYYALIAMASLYGGYIGLSAAMKIQANISALGARRCITPTHKMKLIFSELSTSFLLHMGNILILLLVLRYLYHVSLGGNSGYTLLIAAFGVLLGVSFGFFIGAAFKVSEGVKVGIVTSFSMVASACAGLMDPNVKISIQQFMPVLNRLNPAAAITDALYFVHIYDSPARMWECLSVLGILSLILVVATFFVTRRERYASI